MIENADLSVFLHYMKKFALRYHSIAEENLLEIYTSRITVRDEKSKVQRLFKNQVPRWICSSINSGDEWNSMSQQLESHSEAIIDVAFCCNGHRIVSSARDCTIRVWNADTGEVIKSFYFDGEGHRMKGNPLFEKTPFLYGILMLALSENGTRLASPMNGIMQLDTFGCQVEQEFNFKGDRVALSPDGSQTASTDDSNLVLIWDSSTGYAQQILDGDSPRSQISNKACPYDPDWRTCLLQWVNTGLVQILGSFISVVVSSDGRRLAVAGYRFPDRYYWERPPDDYGRSAGLIRLWDPNTGQVKHTFNFDTTKLSDDSEETPRCSYVIGIWDISTGKVQRIFHYDFGLYPALAFSHDSNSLAIALGSHIRVYDLDNGQMEQVFGGHSRTASRVLCIKFSPDNSKLISGSEDAILRVWEVGAPQKNTSRPHSSIWTALRQWKPQGGSIKPIMIDLPRDEDLDRY